MGLHEASRYEYQDALFAAVTTRNACEHESARQDRSILGLGSHLFRNDVPFHIGPLRGSSVIDGGANPGFTRYLTGGAETEGLQIGERDRNDNWRLAAEIPICQ